MIVWRNTNSHSKAATFGRIHQTLLFYSKSQAVKFHKKRRPRSRSIFGRISTLVRAESSFLRPTLQQKEFGKELLERFGQATTRPLGLATGQSRNLFTTYSTKTFPNYPSLNGSTTSKRRE